jgi:hypothetical protein
MTAQTFTIRFRVPYNDCEWREQSFPTREQAERMAAFYRSCGSPAELVRVTPVR